MAEIEVSPIVAGVVLVRPAVFGDERGRFLESFRQEWLPASARPMIQANRVDRRGGALVGLHFHHHQSDYWYLVSGRARVVLHDLRRGSPTEGATMAVDLDDSGAGPALYIPPGVAHGFAAHSDLTLTYLVDGYYDPADELGVAWDDPDIAAQWGLAELGWPVPVLSGRDQANPRRSELVGEVLPTFGPESAS